MRNDPTGRSAQDASNRLSATVVPISRLKATRLRAARGQKVEAIPSELVIAPSTAVFSIPAGTRSVHPGFRATTVALPTEWNNFTPPPNDPHPERYRLSTRPMNQQRCGSCFACATATALNDVFVFGQSLPYNPVLSPMSIMSCVEDPSNSKCKGGNPIQVIDYLSKSGVVSNHCIDYDSLCNASDGCNHSKKGDPSTFTIPPCEGCRQKECAPLPSRKRYYPKPPVFVSQTPGYDAHYNDIAGNKDAVSVIKQHLLGYGSVVSGFVVFANFLRDRDNGDFTPTYGVYIESEPYNVNSTTQTGGLEFGAKTKDSFDTYKGCHAVVIVGWGVENRPITLASGKKLEKTPYWLVRNSWGTVWGENGYFKLAMYQKLADGSEINPLTAFERFRFYNGEDASGNPVSAPIGGVLLIEPLKVEDDTKPVVEQGSLSAELKLFYCSDSYMKPVATTNTVPTAVPTNAVPIAVPANAVPIAKMTNFTSNRSSTVMIVVAVALVIAISYGIYLYRLE